MLPVVMSEMWLRQESVNPPRTAAQLFWRAETTSTRRAANLPMHPTSIEPIVLVLPARPAVVVLVAATTGVVVVPVAAVVGLVVAAGVASIILMIEKRAVMKQSAFLFLGNATVLST